MLPMRATSRVQLCFSVKGYDLYQVYEQDFLREVGEIWTHGFEKGSLEVRPYAQHTGVTGENWSDFAWQADGQYASFVRHASR